MTDDTRVTCTTCRNLRNGWCVDARRAGFVPARIELARDFAEQPQHCQAHVPRAHFPAPNDASAEVNA